MSEEAPGTIQKAETLFPLPDPVVEPERRRGTEMAISHKKRTNSVRGQMVLDLGLAVDAPATPAAAPG